MDRVAVVARTEGDHAYLELGEAGCGRCHETGGCQSGILGRLFNSRPRQFRVANPIGAMPGDRVAVRIAEGTALRIVLAVYVLPVTLLLMGAVAGGALDAADNDVSTALGALSGLAVGVLVGLTLRGALGDKIEEPVITCRSLSTCHFKEASR